MTNEECYPLSHPQRRIWYTEVVHSDKGICNLRFYLNFIENELFKFKPSCESRYQ